MVAEPPEGGIDVETNVQSVCCFRGAEERNACGVPALSNILIFWYRYSLAGEMDSLD